MIVGNMRLRGGSSQVIVGHAQEETDCSEKLNICDSFRSSINMSNYTMITKSMSDLYALKISTISQQKYQHRLDPLLPSCDTEDQGA